MPQPDGGESQASGLTLVSVSAGPRLEALIALQPAEMLHVLGPFRREGGIERVSLQHTQQLVLSSLAFMVVFLHWLTETDEGRRRHRPGERKPCTVSQPACRNHARQSDCFHTLGYHLHCRFQKTAALNVRSRLHYSSGGLDPSGNDGLLPAISGRREDFPNRPFDAAPPTFSTCV